MSSTQLDIPSFLRRHVVPAEPVFWNMFRRLAMLIVSLLLFLTSHLVIRAKVTGAIPDLVLLNVTLHIEVLRCQESPFHPCSFTAFNSLFPDYCSLLSYWGNVKSLRYCFRLHYVYLSWLRYVFKILFIYMPDFSDLFMHYCIKSRVESCIKRYCVKCTSLGGVNINRFCRSVGCL